MIEVEHLSKTYGTLRAVDDLTFRVDKGEIVGFLGPNGAGKSTTLRMLAGFLGPTAGRVRIDGHDIAEEPMRARASVGYMPETSPLYLEMRVAEYLTFRAELKLIPRRARADAVARALADAKVEDMADVMVGHLSKGYRQRVGLADAIVASPPLLILDEPTAGLDPNQIREVRALIRRLAKDHTVLLSTHILPEVEATCSRALVISRGKLVAKGSIEDLRALSRAPGVRITVSGKASRAVEVAARVAGVSGAKVDRDGEAEEREGDAKSSGEGAPAPLVPLVVRFAPDADGGKTTEQVVGALVAAGLGVREVVRRGASLEQVFSELTTGGPAGAGEEAA